MKLMLDNTDPNQWKSGTELVSLQHRLMWYHLPEPFKV